MRDTLQNILKSLVQNTIFLGQISADVSALKIVVSAFGPEARAALEKQIDVERRIVQPIVEEQQLLLEAMWLGISQISN
jgi:hypothetical protein